MLFFVRDQKYPKEVKNQELQPRWSPPKFLFKQGTLPGIIERTLREETSLFLKGGAPRYVAAKALAQIPFMPDRLAQRLSGLEVPLGEEGQRYAKAVASYYARMKKLEESKNVQGYADRALRESLRPITSHSSVSPQTLKEVWLRMKERNKNYTPFIREASSRRRQQLQLHHSLSTQSGQKKGTSRTTLAYLQMREKIQRENTA